MLRRCSVKELSFLFSRHPKTIERDLRFMASCPYFDKPRFRPLGGGKGSDWKCASEVYEVFLTYHRFFKNGETGEVLQPIEVLAKESPFREPTEDEMYRDDVDADAVTAIYRKKDGRQTTADYNSPEQS